jgi:hypothetical protein
MLRRATHLVLFLFNVAFAGMALFFIFRGGVVSTDSPDLAYADFIAILLTALAVMMAVAAFVVAI